MAELRDIYRIMDLALRIGELMLAAGAGAADVSVQMDNVARACGERTLIADVTFTELAITYQPPDDEPPIIQIRNVRGRNADYSQLTAVDHLVRSLAAGRIDRDEALAQVKTIDNNPPPYPRWAGTTAWGVMGAAIAVMLAAPWLIVGVAFVAACAVDLIARALDRRRVPVFYQRAAGGLFATVLAAGATAAFEDLGPGRVITSSIFLLLAGVSFLGAVQDALTGFPLTSTARFMEALIATAGVLGGVAGGLTMAATFGIGLGDVDPGAIVLATWPWTVGGAAVAAGTFAYACGAPLRSLAPAAAIAAAGTGLYLLAYDAGVGVAWSSALAAVFIGLVSFSVAGRCRVPPLVVVTAAIVPLLPGLTVYRALALFSQGSNSALFALANAAAIALALGAGVIGGEYIAQPLRREARRLELKLAGPRLVGPITVRHERWQAKRAARHDRRHR